MLFRSDHLQVKFYAIPEFYRKTANSTRTTSGRKNPSQPMKKRSILKRILFFPRRTIRRCLRGNEFPRNRTGMGEIYHSASPMDKSPRIHQDHREEKISRRSREPERRSEKGKNPRRFMALDTAEKRGKVIVITDLPNTGKEPATIRKGLPIHHLYTRIVQWFGKTLTRLLAGILFDHSRKSSRRGNHKLRQNHLRREKRPRKDSRLCRRKRKHMLDSKPL